MAIEKTPTPGVAKGSKVAVFVGIYKLKKDKKVKGVTVRKAGDYPLILNMDPGVADTLNFNAATSAQQEVAKGDKTIFYDGTRHGRTASVAHPLGTKTKGGSGKSVAQLQFQIPKGLTRTQIKEAFAATTKVKTIRIKGGRPISVGTAGA